MITIRHASTADIPDIIAIYAHWVLNGTGTFAETPMTESDIQDVFDKVSAAGLSFLIACEESAPDTVLGYAYAAPFRPRNAYRFFVEDSIYIKPGQQKLGIGNALLSRLIDDCTKAGKRQMVAVIGDSANQGSINLHRRHGFEDVGILKSAGFKFGEWRDVVLMQRALGEGQNSLPE